MSFWPIIVRELRSQARQPLTHWLRVIAAASLLAAMGWALYSMKVGQVPIGWAVSMPNPVQEFGMSLFGKMNLLIFVAIWIFVPLATADAVSRERREGTLSLLYLTELRSLGIVVGKSFVHMLRSISLFVTMGPWLMLPLLFGGVGVDDVVMALILDFSSVLLAQAAGLLASTFPRDWLKSAILAQVFALILFLMFLNVHGAILQKAVDLSTPNAFAARTIGTWTPSLPFLQDFDYWGGPSGVLSRTVSLIKFTTNGSFQAEGWYGCRFGMEGIWQQLWTGLAPAAIQFWFAGVIGILLFAALTLAAASWLGAWRVDRTWRDAPTPILTSELRRRFLSPRYGVSFLKRNLSRSLSANPIGWLQHYSPSARMVKWAWCLFIALVEIVLSTNSTDLYAAQTGLGLLLLLGLTFSATGSFRNELETGAFELLLVTPLRERQIIIGRVRGLWRQFLPAILLYAAGSIYLTSGWSDRSYEGEAWRGLARMLMGFCTLPLIGLFFSIQRWNFFAAWFAACLLGLLPAMVGRAYGVKDHWLVSLQIAVALTAAAFLERKLRSRKFLQKQT